MTSININFFGETPFAGAGIDAGITFYELYPPALGCFGFGVSSIGATTTTAKITDLGRQLLARAITDGTSFKLTLCAFGSGGYDPVDPLRPVVIDTTSQSLIQETYRKSISVYETASADLRSRSFTTFLARGELVGGLGEAGLIAQILSSPFPAEIGTTFLFAVMHEGLQSISPNHISTIRIIVTS